MKMNASGTILMTGITGFAGRHIYHHLANNGWQIIAIGRKRPDFLVGKNQFLQGDLLEPESIARHIKTIKPAVVVHSAAASKPNDCETDQSLAHRTNVMATIIIADACAEAGARLVFMSTDFVFGHNGPYTETDAPCPVNYYGETKLMAEQYLLQQAIDCLIIRTVLVYGKPYTGQAGSFLQWVEHAVASGKNIQVYTDQLRTPCYAHDLGRAIAALLQIKARGIFHVCGRDVLTPFAMAIAVAEHLNFPLSLIAPTTAEQRPEPALRPKNASLQIDKLLATLPSFQPTSFREALSQVFPSSSII